MLWKKSANCHTFYELYLPEDFNVEDVINININITDMNSLYTISCRLIGKT